MNAMVGDQHRSDRKFHTFAVIVIVALAMAQYGQIGSHDFVAWDDTSYVSENPVVARGLTWSGIVWAFSGFHLSNWHPLTLISHMADVSAWGMRAGCHAATNVAFHVINSVLVFGLMLKLVQCPGAGISQPRQLALAVAMFFVAHPLHVESVAWISERKDVLCALFWLLATHTYLTYARNQRWWPYIATSFLLACALMAKPMAVTLPMVFLMLDFWPLGRHGKASFMRLVIEKSPWFLMAAIAAWLTIKAQINAMPPLELADRLQIAASAYGWYLHKTLWPSGLHFYYLTEGAWSSARALFAITLIGGLSAAAWRYRRQHPALIVGWLWFLVTLLPVAGFVKAGTQAWADRYTYLPHIGLFVAVVSVALSWATSRRRLSWLGGLFGVYLAVLAVMGARQVAVWRNTEALYQHALREDANHYVAMMGLANLRLREGRDEEAGQLAHRALGLSEGPGLVRAMNGVLGEIALRRNQLPLAIGYLEKARSADPLDADIVVRLGAAYLRAGDLGSAESAYLEGIRRGAESLAAHNGLAVVLAQQGRYVEAEMHLREALRTDPGNRSARHNLAMVMINLGDRVRAEAIYRDLLRDFPGDAAVVQALGRLRHAGGT